MGEGNTSKEELQKELDLITPLLQVDVIRWEEPLPVSVQSVLLNYLYSITQLGLEFPPEIKLSSIRDAHVLLSCTPDSIDRIGNQHWMEAMDLAAEYSAALAQHAKHLKHQIQFFGEHDVVMEDDLFPV